MTKPYVSPSQVGTFADCPRRWGWQYLEGKRPPQKSSAALGERVHHVLEAWLGHATPPDHNEELVLDGTTFYPGRIAESGLHLLPSPSHDLVLESAFQRGVWNGRKDLRYKFPGELPVVSDHKTSSDPKRWGKTDETLKDDVQALVYAWDELEETGADEVLLRWTYFRTRPPYKATVVSAKMSRAEVSRKLGPWTELAETLVQLRSKGGAALDLDPNPQSCSRFGGCPFTSDCNLTPAQLLGGFGMRTLGDKAKDGEKAVDATNGLSSGALEQMSRYRRAEPVPPPVVHASDAAPIPPLPVAVPPIPPLPAGVPPLPVAMVNPPEEPRELLAEPAVAIPPLPAVEAPAKKPRRKKEAPEAQDGPKNASDDSWAGTPPAAPIEPRQEPPVPVAAAGFVLLVDAVPARGRAVTPREAWPEAYTWVEQQQGVPDYRLSSYGKGPSLVAAAIREQQRQKPLPAGSIVTALRCEPAVLEVLIELASDVYLATRS